MNGANLEFERLGLPKVAKRLEFERLGLPKVAKRLEFERLAQPKSRTERQRAERRDGAKSANKPNGTPARRKAGWRGGSQ